MGVGAACMVGIACGADGEIAKEMLEDAGQLLADAGRALSDAGPSVGSDAQAQGGGGSGGSSETHEVQCTDALVRTVVQGGTTTRTVTRLAELSTGTADITGVDVVVCGGEGTLAQEYCPSGATCTGATYAPFMDCAVTSAALGGGKVRAYCGSYIQVNGAYQPGYQRFKTARITVRR